MVGEKLTQLLVGQAVAEAEACVKVASRRYVRLEAWNALRPYEREYLRCYAAGSSAHRSVLVSRSCVLSSCFRPFRLEFLGQFGTVLGRLSVAGVLRVIS